MKIIEVKTKKDKKKYIKFIYDVYKNDKNYCDMNVMFVKNFLYKQDDYSKRCEIIPIMIEDKEEIKLECIYVATDDSNEIRLSFLEFLPNSKKYLEELIKYSKKLIKQLNKEKVVIGVNGQVSYGLGILTGDYNKEFEFNANYNPDYYTKELDKVMPKITKAFSYKYDAPTAIKRIDPKIINYVDNNYTFRYLDKKHFKRDMLIFGEICYALNTTDYYSKKTPYETYQLMKQMKMILKKEDLIFAMKDGKEVGYVFSHPDYAELFNKPKLNYVTFYLKYLFKKTKKIIYDVICVVPEHQHTGVAIGLIKHSLDDRVKNYPIGVSSFILESNIPSTKLCGSLSSGINKEYHLYEIEGDKNA